MRAKRLSPVVVLPARNQSTSIGAPMSSSARPERSRRIEWRPSQATVRSAGISIGPSAPRRDHAGDGVAGAQEVGRLGLHQHLQARERPALLAQEVEEVPLRHHRDERIAGVEPGEVGDAELLGADLALHLPDFLVRQLRKASAQPELVHHRQRRGVDGVAAEVAEEVGVLFQHQGLDAGPPEQVAEHHSRRPAADDAAARRDPPHADLRSAPISLAPAQRPEATPAPTVRSTAAESC